MTETPAPPSLPLDSLVAQLADEFSQRQKCGEQPDVEEYAARHPEHAAVIRNVLASLHLIRMPASGMEETSGDPLPSTLGDFRILREIGRGGMGIVYEAVQVSLNRRVALKVLPFAATMDARQLQRFKNEAQAAAHLHHTNIVPVYSVGCERGVHFYAMQFIEGHSLAEVIAGLRLGKDEKKASRKDAKDAKEDPNATTSFASLRLGASSGSTAVALTTDYGSKPRDYFRKVAELGIQAAEALDCAHQHGIVHRDVKPANLMVESEPGASAPDVRLWITDFGLAQVQSDTRLTMTGDLIGTLRYMSPEQALAKRVVVDHRTDIYSLGVTLYELLTLEPAYRGNDRQELMRQIAFDEPRPPRRLARAIPTELETIVMKAMEKNPADRCATAKDLADDLRRYVLDQPIRARRPTLTQRARKWALRHRSAATAAAVCLLVTLCSVCWFLGDRFSRKRQAEAIVREALEAAKPGLEEGNPWDHGLISALRTAEAQLQTGLLSTELQQRVEQLQKDVKMLAELERIRLESARGVRDEHFDHSGSPNEFRLAFLAYGIDVPNLEPEQAVTLVQRSAILKTLAAGLDHWDVALRGSPKDNGNHEHRQLAAVARSLDSSPWAVPLRDRLGLGDVVGRSLREVERSLEAIPIEELPPARIGVISCMLTYHQGRGIPVSMREIEFLRRAQARYPADFWINQDLALGLGHLQPPRLQEAVGFFRVAVALRPNSPGAHVNLGWALVRLGRLDEGIAAYQKAIELKPDFALAHSNLGNAFEGKGMFLEAITECRRAIKLKPDFADAHSHLGFALREKGMLDESIAECRKAIELKPDFADAHRQLGETLREKGMLDEAIAEHRKAIELNSDDAHAHNSLGVGLHSKGMLEEAITEYRKAIELKPDLADAHNNLGAALKERCILDEAIAEFRKAIQLKPDNAKTHYNLGGVFLRKGMLDEAITEFRKAIKLKPDYSEAHNNLAVTLAQFGLLDEAVAEIRKAIEFGLNDSARQDNLKRLLGWKDSASKLTKILQGDAQPADAAERIALAELCVQPFKKLYVTGYRFYVDAFAAQPELVYDLEQQHRYSAACAASQAGCGQGKDADQIDDKERPTLRRQALDWLRADLAAYRQLLDKEPDKARPMIAQRMQHWLQDKDFAGVRGTEALAKLPEAERAEWSKLWQDVAALGKQAAEGKPGKQAPAASPEIVPPPKEVDARKNSSLNLINRAARIARDQSLVRAVHEQVENFEDRGADQGGLPFRLDDGRKGVVTAEQLDVCLLGHVSLGSSAVGVADFDFLAEGQAQIFDDGPRKYERDGPRINDAGNCLAPHLVLGQQSTSGQGHVVVVRHLEFDAESSHAVGSFGTHGRIPPRTSGG